MYDILFLYTDLVTLSGKAWSLPSDDTSIWRENSICKYIMSTWNFLYSPCSHMWSVTWLDFYPNVSFSNKFVMNQNRALRASQFISFLLFSSHKFRDNHFETEMPHFNGNVQWITFPTHFSLFDGMDDGWEEPVVDGRWMGFSQMGEMGSFFEIEGEI